jgi:hypothetical protein
MGRSIHTGTAGSGGGIGSLNVIANKITSTQTNDDIEFEPNGTGKVELLNSTAASSTSTGALVVVGGVGIGGNLWVGGNIEGAGTINGGTF